MCPASSPVNLTRACGQPFPQPQRIRAVALSLWPTVTLPSTLQEVPTALDSCRTGTEQSTSIHPALPTLTAFFLPHKGAQSSHLQRNLLDHPHTLAHRRIPFDDRLPSSVLIYPTDAEPTTSTVCPDLACHRHRRDLCLTYDLTPGPGTPMAHH